MMTQTCAPPELLNDLVCNYDAGNCNEGCRCFTNEQPCTADCKCRAILPENVGIDDTGESVCTNPVTIDAFIHSFEGTNCDSDTE